MNGKRADRRGHQYRGGQEPRKLTEVEETELASENYMALQNRERFGRLGNGPPSFKQTAVPYTKSYTDNKEVFDALGRARFDKKMVLWPRNEFGNRMTWRMTQVEDNPTGYAMNAAEAVEMNKFYPHQDYSGGLFCLAPFRKGEKCFYNEFYTPNPNDEAPICKALAIPEIWLKVIKYMSYNDISAVQGSCILLANMVMSTPTHWDTSRADCSFNEFTQDEFTLMKETGHIGENVQQGISPFVMISQSHLGYHKEISFQEPPTNTVQIQSLLRVARSLQLTGHIIKRVCFNRVNYLDIGVVATFLDHMPNLERLDITSCDLIRFHHVPSLLKIVHAHNKRHGSKVMLDVFPRYHTGAPWENDDDPTEREGTFGLTHSNPGVKLTSAVCKLFIYDIYPLMVETDQKHLMDHNALFRRYMEQLPLHSKAVPRMEAVAENKISLEEKLASGKMHNNRKIRLQIDAHFAELITVFGKEGWIQLYEDSPVSTNYRGTRGNYGLWTKPVKCVCCGRRLMIMYFTTGYVCDSCLLIEFVDRENYHWKRQRKGYTRRLGCSPFDGELVPLEKAKFDLGLLRTATGGPRITKPRDFDRIIERNSRKLRPLFDRVRAMDNRWEYGPNVYDICFQIPHPYDRNPSPYDNQQDNQCFARYRKPLTLEKIQKVPKGRVRTNIGEF